MKSLTFFLLILSLSFSSIASDSEFCSAFKAGYRSITNNLTIEPVCSEEPPIVFGQGGGVRGFKVGVKAAKIDFEMGISNGYKKKERCESGWCRFKDVHYVINAVFVFIFVAYAGFAFLSVVILKEPIYLRLRHRHRNIWEEMGSPKLFALMENFHLLEELSESKISMNEIGYSDQLLLGIINLTISINKVVNKATWLVLVLAIIGGINMLVAKNY